MTQNEYSKIITHSGPFHADEILAIATVFYFDKKITVERSFKIAEESLNDPRQLILDIGKKYDPSLGNFDHHQDGDLPATNLLILNHFCKDEKLKAYLIRHLFQYVSDVDTGKIIERNNTINGINIPSFNAIVKNLNRVENGFDIALEIANQTLDAFVKTAYKIFEAKENWLKLTFEKNIAIQHTSDKIVGWEDLAKKDQIYFLITPNLREGYQIISRNSAEFPIPSSPSQTFLHPSKFLAVYANFDDALKHARILIKNI